MTKQANVQASYQKAIQESHSGNTIRTEIYTGRPARTLKNSYNMEWEKERHEEKTALLKSGVIPWFSDIKEGKLPNYLPSPIPSGYHNLRDTEDKLDLEKSIVPVGQICGALRSVEDAKEVVEDLVKELKGALFRLQR